VVRNVSIYKNYVFQNGRVGIMWQANDGLGGTMAGQAEGAGPVLGSSVAVVGNHVQVLAGTVLWSVTGSKLARGSDTNENRGYDQAGRSAATGNSGTWFEGNTGNINRQRVPDGSGCGVGKYETTDGEGILQQIQDGQVAERNVWRDNDLSFGAAGPMSLYALHAVADMVIVGNKVNAQNYIGIQNGGSTPPNGTGIHDLQCSGNNPPAKCH